MNIRNYLLLVLSFLGGFIQNEVKAQFYVDYDGSATVGELPLSTSATLNVYSNSDTFSNDNLVLFDASNTKQCGLQIINMSSSMSNTSDRITGQTITCNILPSKSTKGIDAYCYSNTALNNSRSFGVFSATGNAKDGFNYGVCATLLGSNDGTGLYATSGNSPEGYELQGKWAGYFEGNVKVVGNLTATSVNSSSDSRLKRDIRQIENGSLDKIMEMNTVRYYLKNPEVNLWNSTEKHYLYDPDSPILKQEHFGLIAQELMAIYPELVTEGSDGYYAVNYLEIVPLLIKSIQELKVEVDELKGMNAEMRANERNLTGIAGINTEEAVLFQNNPNPFSESTSIRCFVPTSVNDADIYIYNMNGEQIDKLSISERGDVSVPINGYKLEAGMYLYSLITDGSLVDTKRMVLTK